MDEEGFKRLEVKPRTKGWYRVTLFDTQKSSIDNNSYFQKILYFNDKEWHYKGYKDCCVCFIHKKLKKWVKQPES